MYFANMIRIGTIAAILTGSLFMPAGSALAQSEAADQAKRRVNLAGRQRMFSQRMSKAACFILTGVEVDNHTAMLAKTIDRFSVANGALRNGSAEAGIPEETNLEVIGRLVKVDSRWQDFAPRVKAVLDGSDVSAGNVAAINESGLALLTDMNDAVHRIDNVYGDELSDLPLILAVTIDLAGRQRMFTQKVAKDFCLIDAGIDVAANTADLAETLQYFNATLDALVDGFPGTVVPAPNADIRAKLTEVRDLWAGPDAVLAAVAGGAAISDADRLVVANDVEKVLVAMNEAVNLYEFVDNLGGN